MMFLKGYTPEGFRGQAYHLHVRYPGDWNELYFRDYLRDHPDAATEYAELKRGLKERFEHDRDGYTNAKTEWIEQHTRLARMNTVTDMRAEAGTKSRNKIMRRDK
jgi:GrpB-like predicted nucleotidyltransferase (UPF0157 family)